MKNRMLWGLAAALALSLGAWLLWPSSLPFAVRAYHRIRLGMTPAEVETAVGVPSGIYYAPFNCSSGPLGKCIQEAGVPFKTALERGTRLESEQWCWQDYWIWVVYDDTGRAVGCYLLEGYPWHRNDPPPDRPGFFDRVRTWLGL
jgi:hypothetical protein